MNAAKWAREWLDANGSFPCGEENCDFEKEDELATLIEDVFRAGFEAGQRSKLTVEEELQK